MEYLVYFGLGILSLVVFYYIIKGAVKNGILAAKEEEEIKVDARAGWTPAQHALQKQYERGEITTDAYQNEFNRLKTEQPLPNTNIFTVGQIALREKYERGEITIEQYKKDWHSV